MRLRVATFNVENLDDKPDLSPSFAERLPRLRDQFRRLDADILCLQEVHGQETTGEPRRLRVLDELLAGTPYAGFHVAHTLTSRGEAYDVRNLAILSRYPFSARAQYRNDLMAELRYRKVTELGENNLAADDAGEAGDAVA